MDRGICMPWDKTPLPRGDLWPVVVVQEEASLARLECTAVVAGRQQGDVLLGDGIRLLEVEGGDFLGLVQPSLPCLDKGCGDVLRLQGLCMLLL